MARVVRSGSAIEEHFICCYWCTDLLTSEYLFNAVARVMQRVMIGTESEIAPTVSHQPSGIRNTVSFIPEVSTVFEVARHKSEHGGVQKGN